jgi:hypothetical protein
MAIRITGMLVRICGLLALILGILFWVNDSIEEALVNVHMLLGIIITISIWIMGIIIIRVKGGNVGLGIAAIVLGLLVIGLGLSQQSLLVNSAHWVIQVIHLLFGLAAIGIGEVISARYKRINKAA